MKKIVIDIIARYLLFPKLCYPGLTMGLLPLVKNLSPGPTAGAFL